MVICAVCHTIDLDVYISMCVCVCDFSRFITVTLSKMKYKSIVILCPENVFFSPKSVYRY